VIDAAKRRHLPRRCLCDLRHRILLAFELPA
jgi:hypothetical protein